MNLNQQLNYLKDDNHNPDRLLKTVIPLHLIIKNIK